MRVSKKYQRYFRYPELVEVTGCGVLVSASPTTRYWLDIIKAKVSIDLPSAKYYESKYWASFKSSSTNRRFVYLHPQIDQIRLFTSLPVSFADGLKVTSSTGAWAKMYPSIFNIRSEEDIEEATYLIIESHACNLK